MSKVSMEQKKQVAVAKVRRQSFLIQSLTIGRNAKTVQGQASRHSENRKQNSAKSMPHGPRLCVPKPYYADLILRRHDEMQMETVPQSLKLEMMEN